METPIVHPMIETLQERAAALSKVIVLPEGEEVRTLRAAQAAVAAGTARPVLLGNEDRIRALAQKNAILLADGIDLIDPLVSEQRGSYADNFYHLRKSKGLTREEAEKQIRNSLYFGAMMVRRGDADGSVAGAASTTADVLRAAIQIIGVHPESDIVSSFFLLVLPDGRAVTFADCGVVPYPDSRQLASIAIDSAESHRRLTHATPRVAMLSFSTKGSARHDRVDLIHEAFGIARDRRPDIVIDGELQFDAAFVPDVAARKAPGSPLRGDANVFIFPNLDAANIGYKIAERLGGASAFGPVLQGLAKPANDLSRGASVHDIENVIAITSILAGY